MIETLLVDDEFWGCQLLRDLVNWEQYGCHIAGMVYSGQEAYDFILAHSPALVFTDIRMPGMNGIELMQRCTRENLSCRFVMVSGHSDFDYARSALQCGALDYLVKPVEPQQLVNCLTRAVKTVSRAAEQESGNLRLELEHSRRQLKEEFFRNCRTRDFHPLKELTMKEINDRCGSSFTDETFRAVQYTIDTSLNAEYIAPILETLQDMVYEQLAPLCQDMVALRSAHSVLVLLNYTPDSAEGLRSKTRLIFSTLREEVLSRANCVLTLGIGRATEGNPSEAFLSAAEAIHSRINLGTGRIIDGSGENGKTVYAEDLFDTEAKQMLSDYILDRSQESARSTVEILSEKCFFNGHANPASSIRILREVLHYIYAVPTAAKHSITFPVTLENAWAELESYSAWNQIENYLTDLLESFRSLCRESISSSSAAEIIHDFIDAHFAEEISLTSLGNLVHLNSKYISDLFKNTYGYTITAHLTERRIAEAQRLLAHTSLSVNDIGAQVGIGDPKHFSKIFRKEVGLSPRDYRKLYSE